MSERERRDERVLGDDVAYWKSRQPPVERQSRYSRLKRFAEFFGVGMLLGGAWDALSNDDGVDR